MSLATHHHTPSRDGAGPEQHWTKAGPIAVSLPEADTQRLQQTQEVTAAEPAPLGLFGFATGTIAIGYVLSGFLPHSAQIGTIPVLLVFAGIAQFLAGMWGFRKNNTFAATAFSCYGANNTVVAVFLLLSAAGLIPMNRGADVTLSIELFSFAWISLILGAAALKLNPVFVAILWTLVPGFCLAALGLIGEPAILGHIGGYCLITSAVLAFYAASAIVLNCSYRSTVLPLFGKA